MPNERLSPLVAGYFESIDALFKEVGIESGSDFDTLPRKQQFLIATKLGTGVEDLLDDNPIALDVVTNRLPYGLPEGVSGFWGNVGIQLPGEKGARWFAITTEAMGNLDNDMKEPGWIAFPTLDNRAVCFHTDRVQKIHFVAEATDPPRDWDPNLGAGSIGHSQAFFEALDAWALADQLVDHEAWSDIPSLLQQRTRDFVDNVGRERAMFVTEHTSVHYVDGTIETREFVADSIAEFYGTIHLEMDPGPFMILRTVGEHDIGYPIAQLAMVDMPLRRIIDFVNENGEWF